MTRRTLLQSMPAAALAVTANAQTARVGKPRLRTAICAYSFRTQLESKAMTYDDLVKLAVDLDVDGLDLTVYWFPSTDDSFLLPLKRLAYKNGVEIYSISVRTDLCKPPGETRDKQAAELRNWVDVGKARRRTHSRLWRHCSQRIDRRTGGRLGSRNAQTCIGIFRLE